MHLSTFVVAVLLYALPVLSENVLYDVVSPLRGTCFKASGFSFQKNWQSVEESRMGTRPSYNEPGTYLEMKGKLGKVNTEICQHPNSTSLLNFRDTYFMANPMLSPTANSQMAVTLEYLRSFCKPDLALDVFLKNWQGRLWLDVRHHQFWSLGFSGNQAFYRSFVDGCGLYRVKCGVYSSIYQWETIFGSATFSYGVVSEIPLWLAHNAELSAIPPFTAFGKWPDIYTSDVIRSGVSYVDMDYDKKDPTGTCQSCGGCITTPVCYSAETDVNLRCKEIPHCFSTFKCQDKCLWRWYIYDQGSDLNKACWEQN